MASSQDKHLPATQQRIQKARNDGQVAHSQHLKHLAILGGGAMVLFALLPGILNQLLSMMRTQLKFNAMTLAQPSAMIEQVQTLSSVALKATLPLSLWISALAVLSSVLVSGFLITIKPLGPDFSKINPLTGLGRLFSKDKLSEVALLVLIVTGLCLVTGLYIHHHIHLLAVMSLQHDSASLLMAGRWLMEGLALLLLVILLMAAVDTPLQFFLHHQRLKMSLQDMKDEFKASEGNPDIKNKRRAKQREIAQQNSVRQVEKADFVLTNPTHYAVAICYDDTQLGAPRVIAKGADLIALKIRQAAQQHSIPLLESPRLARALFTHTEIDEEIPTALYMAVAQVKARNLALALFPMCPKNWTRTALALPKDALHERCFNAVARTFGIGAPLVVVAILAMMVLPLPSWVLDIFFTLNIAVALMVMMVASYTKKALDFAVFPTVLLISTLLRLSLNVASTRVVLLDGHTGPGAAGAVIEAFGHFLIGGNFAVGLIVFAILVVINFIVVTKGSERIAEVSARFALDAMPGKQMAIDADLNAGLIDNDQAKKRRSEVGDEADFFGAMDGAAKFVRGDAIAGILILFINIIGGLTIGMLQHDLSATQAANTYILLAVGDALVAQIPGLLISISAAMVVSRVGNEQDVGRQVAEQMLGSPLVLGVTGGMLVVLGLIPGMPLLVFMPMGALLAFAAWRLTQTPIQNLEDASTTQVPADSEASWDDLQPVDPLGLELGYRLITLVDKDRQGDLLSRIKGVRKKFAQEMGFLPPSVHVKDNLDLKPSAYNITLRGVVIARGEAFPGRHLAINPGGVSVPVIGNPTTDPAFGLPAFWIDENQIENSLSLGFTVVDCETVMATHLSHLMQTHAARLLSRMETQQLVEHITALAPKLIEEVVPKLISIPVFQKVLQLLLNESVHIRDMRTIIETLAEFSQINDPEELARKIRIALAPAIVQHIYGTVNELEVMALDPALERMLMQALANPNGGQALDPGVADMLSQSAMALSREQEDNGMPACLLVPDPIRSQMARLLRRIVPRLQVLAHSEIPDTHSIRIGPILRGNTG
eukprot:gene22659-28803_t